MDVLPSHDWWTEPTTPTTEKHENCVSFGKTWICHFLILHTRKRNSNKKYPHQSHEKTSHDDFLIWNSYHIKISKEERFIVKDLYNSILQLDPHYFPSFCPEWWECIPEFYRNKTMQILFTENQHHKMVCIGNFYVVDHWSCCK